MTADCQSANLSLSPHQDTQSSPGTKSASSWFSWFGGKSDPSKTEVSELKQEEAPEVRAGDQPGQTSVRQEEERGHAQEEGAADDESHLTQVSKHSYAIFQFFLQIGLA